MRVGVSHGQSERGNRPAHGDLQRIVIGTGAVLFAGDVAKARIVRAHQIGIYIPAGHIEIVLHAHRQRGDVRPICVTAVAITIGQRNTGRVGVLRSRGGDQLIQVALIGQIGALAAHVGDRSDNVLNELMLDAQIPLLRVWPDGFARNGNDRERERQRRAAGVAQAGVTGRLAAGGPGDIRLPGVSTRGALPSSLSALASLPLP